MPVPLTILLAPAYDTISILSQSIPPSIPIFKFGYNFLNCLTLSSMSTINFCPPNPGSIKNKNKRIFKNK